jgi:hypothetical protein
MALNRFSVGRDTQLVLIGPLGRVDLSYVTGFEARQLTKSIRVDRLDGHNMGAELPKGWEGTFDIERGSSAADDFIISVEQAYYNGGQPALGTMYQYITEPDGSTSTYQYVNVSFRLSSAGQWKGDSSVKQKLEFYATGRLRI